MSGLLALVLFRWIARATSSFPVPVSPVIRMRGRTETKDVAPYMIFQTAGALIAATGVKYLDPTAVVHPRVLAVFPALLAEFLFTFALVFVVINTATVKGTSGNSFYGLAIGFTVLAGAFAMGSVTVGAFNPAVAVGVSAMGMIAWSQLWVFLVANFLGGAAAALTFKFLCPTDK
jgi:aquaporin Z